MCCLFGIIDYNHSLSSAELNRAVNALLAGGEERGTDASGISYVRKNRVCVYKRPIAGYLLRPCIPAESRIVMGHTRMTTQGSEKININNHPFIGNANGTHFLLAHNGVIFNDTDLRLELQFPK